LFTEVLFKKISQKSLTSNLRAKERQAFATPFAEKATAVDKKAMAAERERERDFD
jgi:hypothetical protein